MKVLLISQPNTNKQKPDFPPIGIAYLGAVAEAAGHKTKLIDAGLTDIPGIIKDAERFSPEFIGVTCWSIGRKNAWKLCAELKKVFPTVFLTLGGPHSTIFPEHIFLKTHASAVVLGEGEETFRELLNALKGGKDLKTVLGLALPNDDGTVYFSGQRKYIDNLDKIPKPFYKGFQNFSFSNYCGRSLLPGPTAPIISSRGCVFNCTYCGSVKFWGDRWRFRSSESILNEIEWLVKTMGAKSIFFFDDNMPVNKKRLIDICEGMIRKKMNIKWACCSHVKLVNKELLEIMRRSGCVSIEFGVESGSDKILKTINKKQTRADIEKTFIAANKVGIKPLAYLMVGNTGENKQTIDETIEMVGRIKPYSSIGASIVWLLPGTADYNKAVKNGYIKDDFWVNSFDDILYNLQEHTYKDLFSLRTRLMFGIAKNKKGVFNLVICFLKIMFYKYPKLSFMKRFKGYLGKRL